MQQDDRWFFTGKSTSEPWLKHTETQWVEKMDEEKTANEITCYLLDVFFLQIIMPIECSWGT